MRLDSAPKLILYPLKAVFYHVCVCVYVRVCVHACAWVHMSVCVIC